MAPNTCFSATPPFIPTISSKDDTSNFDDFERGAPTPDLESNRRRGDFSGKDLPFVGFTFTKQLFNERCV